ncbi:MAG TPA: methyltransferase [Bryobacteraceae bacterium]
MLRALASVGVFAETEGGRFTLTPLAQTLRSDVPESVRAMARFMAIPACWQPWGHLTHSVRTGETGIKKAFGLDNAFDYISSHPEETEIFNQAMSDHSRQETPAVVEAYDFSRFPKIVDVAGGYGTLLSAILKKHPGVHGTIYEMPQVVDGALRAIQAAGLSDRCDVVSGDFFREVPAGADAYLMKHIIHDWDDERANTILRNCRKGLAAGGRVLLAEIVIPPGNDFSFGKLLDLEMMAIPGGKERTEAEYRDLFAAAGLRLTSITPTKAPISVIEAAAA